MEFWKYAEAQKGVLARRMRSAWPRFRERCEEVSGGGLARFVRREVDGYLRCGLLEHGCADARGAAFVKPPEPCFRG